MVAGIDGEWALYHRDHPSRAAPQPDLFTWDGGFLNPVHGSVGNVAAIRTDALSAHLATDPSGTFPLYFTEFDGGVLFCSLLKPLAKVTRADRDELAGLEFLRQAYVVGTKTVFRGIRRLLPGQSVRWLQGRSIEITERSDAWTDRVQVTGDAIEASWERLERAMARSVPTDGASLMMSGGWDSRTLLAGGAHKGLHLSCYSHGDTGSRELGLVRRLADITGSPCQLEPIDERVLDPGFLSEGFSRVENVVFPHWHRAGRVLAGQGRSVVSAGVFGEILGGHYGPAMVTDNRMKFLTVAALLTGLEPPAAVAKASALELLRVRSLEHHWYLQGDWERALGAPLGLMNGAIEEELARLGRRGVAGTFDQVEAFISEHRGAQYINTQIRSCRGHLDVSLPFAGGELFPFASGVPLSSRVHNLVNRRMLLKYSPELLAVPLAATLAAARAPLGFQEASRVLRKLYEEVGGAVSHRTRGRWPAPRLGWVNFGFLQSSTALATLAEDLRCDLWDRVTISRYVGWRSGGDQPEPHPLYDQFLKLYTLDLLWR
ncbi:MAG TPA: hypothetical protein VMC86_00825 [Gemmatimonadales bacterium]|nr:hypothetical protein [Gemmatimonadales bacterium]